MKSGYHLQDASYFCGGSCQRKRITLPACAGGLWLRVWERRSVFLEGPFTQGQMPFQRKILAPEMRDIMRRWSLLLRKTWEEQLR